MYNATDSLENKSATGWQSFKVKGVGAQENPSSKKELKILPNPCINYIKVIGEPRKEIDIFDISGKYLGKRAVKNGEVNLSDLHSGIYFIEKKKVVKLSKSMK